MKKSLILVVATIIFSSFASAADNVVVPTTTTAAGVPISATDLEATFKILDKNLDGVISLTEAEGQEKLLSAFPTVDLDKTGDLNEDEFKNFVMMEKK